MHDCPIKQKVAGREYSVIGWCTNKRILSCKEDLLKLLHEICYLINMRPLQDMGLDVELDAKKKDLTLFEDEGGSTASLILSTSHANIHGWPIKDETRTDGGFFWFTIGSCRDFSTQIVDNYLKDKLGTTNIVKTGGLVLIP
jgi:hypothetical protein